ncbi:hypothetical protein C2E23DRAFT_852358 [Lenzites betulinus]|nr:hypothetical protein C2E23DRAFT_852358 [Lenzites betulinus]
MTHLYRPGQAKTRLFDLQIFLLEDMLPFATGAARVPRDWEVLSLNPYVVFTTALRTISAAYPAPPACTLVVIEEECLGLHIRAERNAAVPRWTSVPFWSPKDWELEGAVMDDLP